jgi:hypothetical protein
MPSASIGGGRAFLAATQSLLWPLYLVWSGCVVAVWTVGIGEVELQNAVTHPDLRAALQAVLSLIDPLWITFGFYHVYGAIVVREGISQARRWIGAGLLVCLLIAWISSSTSWPLGPVHFTERLGKRFGPVPLCLPLLWLTMFLGARATAARLLSAALPKAVLEAAVLVALVSGRRPCTCGSPVDGPRHFLCRQLRGSRCDARKRQGDRPATRNERSHRRFRRRPGGIPSDQAGGRVSLNSGQRRTRGTLPG